MKITGGSDTEPRSPTYKIKTGRQIQHLDTRPTALKVAVHSTPRLLDLDQAPVAGGSSPQTTNTVVAHGYVQFEAKLQERGML